MDTTIKEKVMAEIENIDKMICVITENEPPKGSIADAMLREIMETSSYISDILKKAV